MSTTLVRSVRFECLHRYENPKWDAAKNREIFGACYTPNGHGHSYRLDVAVNGQIDPATGMVINLKDLDSVVKSVVARLAGKHLNFEVPEFKTVNPTTENILIFLFDHLREGFRSTSVHLSRVRLYENDDLWVDMINETNEPKS